MSHQFGSNVPGEITLVNEFVIGLCNRYICDCQDTGFNGTNCQDNIDDCASNPCQHGSSCQDGIKVSIFLSHASIYIVILFKQFSHQGLYLYV